jgi:hypothetical protein
MKIICKKINAKGVDLNEVKTIHTNEFDYSFGSYGLQLNMEYLVMGIILYKEANCLYYLIDLHSKPYLFPYVLFDISDNMLPPSWNIKVYNKFENDIYCIWGFEELCNDDLFFEQLMDRKDKAMRIYFKRKIEMEK